MEVKLDSLDYKLIEDLSGLEPFGEQNPRPIFCSRNLRLTRPMRVIKGSHIKLWVTDGIKNLEAIGFGLAKINDTEATLRKYSEVDLAYTISLNTWQGLNSIQLTIENIRPS